MGYLKRHPYSAHLSMLLLVKSVIVRVAIFLIP